MAIILPPSAPSAETREGFHNIDQVLAVTDPELTPDNCFFCLFNCEKPILQFIDLADPSNKRTNDFNLSFVFKLPSGATMDAFIIELDGTEHVLNATYGINKPVGIFPEQPLVYGFIVNWALVQAGLGFGKYTFRFDIKSVLGTVLSSTTTTCFHLMPFSCEAADGTVRIETIQTGYIVNGFDYRGLNANFASGFDQVPLAFWPQQVRWYGALIPTEPDVRNDNIVLSTYKKQQIQQQVIENFTLRLDLIRSGLGNQLIKDNFLANSIKISDYNRNNYEEYTQKDLKFVSVDEYNRFKYQRGMFITTTWQSTDEGTIKRNNG